MIDLPERKECDVGGMSISYLEEGRGEPFMMVHGLMSNAVDFLFQFREFGGGFRCIAPDLRGHGLSRTDDMDGITMEQAVEDMEAFIGEVVPKSRKVTLLGHSFGGMVVQELLARIPKRLRRVVIVGAPADFSSKPVLKAGITLYNLIIPYVKSLISGRAIDFYAKWINIPPWNLSADLRDLLTERNSLMQEEDLVMMGRYFASVMDWRTPEMDDDAAKVPVMIVYGQNDLLLGEKELRELEEAIPDSRSHIVKGTRHSPLNEKPDVFNKLLSDFFKDT